MEIRDFVKEMISDFFLIFTFSILIGFTWLLIWGGNALSIQDIVASLVISLLCTLAGIVMYQSRGLKMRELLVRHIIHLLIMIIIVLSVASFRGWISWDAPITVIMLVGLLVGAYIIGLAIQYYQSDKLMDELNKKLKERNREKESTA